jgi:hypothetical protein
LGHTQSGLLSQLLNPDPKVFPPVRPYHVVSTHNVTHTTGIPSTLTAGTSHLPHRVHNKHKITSVHNASPLCRSWAVPGCACAHHRQLWHTTHIVSDAFEGQILTYIKGFTDEEGNILQSENEYFQREDRKGITWSIQSQGTSFDFVPLSQVASFGIYRMFPSPYLCGRRALW